MKTSGQIFRELHEQTAAFVIPNPWDIGSARILAAMGFKALATTSAGMAYALGKPDGSVSKQEVLAHCADIANATSLPVSADLEKGFGDSPESVFETIVVTAETGLAGCSIEDYTGHPEKPIFETSLAVERIQAASEARNNLEHDFVLTARCEKLAWGEKSLDDVVERLNAFADAGADVLFAPGVDELDSIRELCAAVNKPVNVIVQSPNLSYGVEELADVGVKRISVGSTLAQLAYTSLVSSAQEINNSGSFKFINNALDWVELESYFKPTTDQ